MKYAQAEYSGIINITLKNYVKDITFTNPVQKRKVHRELMNEVSSEA